MVEKSGMQVCTEPPTVPVTKQLATAYNHFGTAYNHYVTANNRFATAKKPRVTSNLLLTKAMVANLSATILNARSFLVQ